MKMSKSEVRSNLSADIAAFIENGGVVTVLKASTRKPRATYRAKTKLTFGEKQPGRVVSSWGLVESSR